MQRNVNWYKTFFIFQSFCELTEKYQTSDLRNCQDQFDIERNFGPQVKLSMLREKNVINRNATVY